MTLPGVLEDMLTTGRAPNGETLHSNIARSFAEAIQRVTAARQPAVCVETGMAFGASALAMLAGTHGEVISIDPFQLTDYRSGGVDAIQQAGYTDRHRLVAEPSYLGLTRLIDDGVRIQFAYIDGMHTFDYALVDFFLIDKLLDIGGVVAFNDCWLPSVDRVIRFMLGHRVYRELDVGLQRSYPLTRNPLKALRFRARDHQTQDRYFEKTGDHEPAWDFYRPF